MRRHAVGEPSLETFRDGIAGRVDIIVEKLKNEVVTGVGNREILREHLVEPLILAFFRWSVKLQEIPERLKLHVKGNQGKGSGFLIDAKFTRGFSVKFTDIG